MEMTHNKTNKMRRPTPETDAVAAYECNWDTKALRMTAHARRLERQRDEEREDYRAKLREMNSIHTPETDATAEKNIYGVACKVDVDFARKLERERDEARSIAQQLIHIASHCLGWHDNANPETIAEAIKRWNASKK